MFNLLPERFASVEHHRKIPSSHFLPKCQLYLSKLEGEKVVIKEFVVTKMSFWSIQHLNTARNNMQAYFLNWSRLDCLRWYSFQAFGRIIHLEKEFSLNMIFMLKTQVQRLEGVHSFEVHIACKTVECWLRILTCKNRWEFNKEKPNFVRFENEKHCLSYSTVH